MPDVLKVDGVGTASNVLKIDGVALANLLKWNGVAFPSGVDADAATFIAACHTAGHDLTANEQTYLNTLVVDLKAAGVWTKCIAIYPIIGGVAATVVINLKNPGTYNLTLIGSPTVSDNGIDWNGSSQYAKTGIIPSSHLSQDDCHISYYSRDDISFTSVDMGASDDGSFKNALQLTSGNASTILSCRVNCDTAVTKEVSDSLGFSCANRQASDNFDVWRSSSKTDGTQASTGLCGYELYIGAKNGGGNANYRSNRECAFATIGTKLTDTEAGDMYSAIQDFQTSLGRQV